jgi:hypothetical protein
LLNGRPAAAQTALARKPTPAGRRRCRHGDMSRPHAPSYPYPGPQEAPSDASGNNTLTALLAILRTAPSPAPRLTSGQRSARRLTSRAGNAQPSPPPAALRPALRPAGGRAQPGAPPGPRQRIARRSALLAAAPQPGAPPRWRPRAARRTAWPAAAHSPALRLAGGRELPGARPHSADGLHGCPSHRHVPTGAGKGRGDLWMGCAWPGGGVGEAS